MTLALTYVVSNPLVLLKKLFIFLFTMCLVITPILLLTDLMQFSTLVYVLSLVGLTITFLKQIVQKAPFVFVVSTTRQLSIFLFGSLLLSPEQNNDLYSMSEQPLTPFAKLIYGKRYFATVISSKTIESEKRSNNLTVYAVERVFTTMILAKLDYCDFVWNTLAPSGYNSLERLQTRAARIVLKDSNLSHHQLLRQLSWKSLKARSTMHNLTFVFKCLHNIAPDLFKCYFIKSSHVHSTRRNGLDILIPKVRTESTKKGTFSTGAQDFNNLPAHLRLYSDF